MSDALQNESRDGYLSLGRFAQAAQLSRKALRLYDQLGILVPDHVDPDSGYRYYSPEQLDRARFIRLLRGMEMPLADIRRVLATPSAAEAVQLVLESRTEFEKRVEQVRRATEKVIAYIKKEQETMSLDISVQSFPESRVVSITKHIKVEPFQTFIPTALKQISAFIKESGATIVGDPICFYYGPVNESDDGPVEICLPVEGQIAPSGEIQIHTVPAHRAAVGTAPVEQSKFPEIIDAWDAVMTWVRQNKFKMSDEPVCCYEIWHEDFSISIVQPFLNGDQL